MTVGKLGIDVAGPGAILGHHQEPQRASFSAGIGAVGHAARSNLGIAVVLPSPLPQPDPPPTTKPIRSARKQRAAHTGRDRINRGPYTAWLIVHVVHSGGVLWYCPFSPTGFVTAGRDP